MRRACRSLEKPPNRRRSPSRSAITADRERGCAGATAPASTYVTRSDVLYSAKRKLRKRVTSYARVNAPTGAYPAPIAARLRSRSLDTTETEALLLMLSAQACDRRQRATRATSFPIVLISGDH